MQLSRFGFVFGRSFACFSLFILHFLLGNLLLLRERFFHVILLRLFITLILRQLNGLTTQFPTTSSSLSVNVNEKLLLLMLVALFLALIVIDLALS